MLMAMEKMTIKINLNGANVKTIVENGIMTIVIENQCLSSPIVMESEVVLPKCESTEAGAIEEKRVKIVYDEDESDDEEEEDFSEYVTEIKRLISKIDYETRRNEYANYFRKERMDVVDFEFNRCVEAIEKHLESQREVVNKDLESDIERFSYC